MRQLPHLRRPSRYERFFYRLTGRWPKTYVEARLDTLHEFDRVLATLTPEALRAVMRKGEE